MGTDWSKTQELFFAAADLPPGERSRFLDASCAGDDALRGELESLLAADEDHNHDIVAAVQFAAQEVLDADPLLDTRLGPWRVMREIGRGGMGVVYLAVRDDSQYQKQAALKLVKHGMDTAELMDRLRQERQILAGLDHPHVARLIDGGTTREGRPYLVMEYVEGQRIDTWCRDHGLSVEERCRLMLKVCEAVSYAHRNLVVHRDLKPGNILVTPDGTPKLLDFGVAKLLAPDRDTTVTSLAGGGRALTPDYASPEQVRGEPITTATDVYSLGAILYELLTGTKVHRLSSNTAAEVERAICQTQVVRPSEAVGSGQPHAARTRRRLTGDLDNILLMALRKEPGRRYASVDQFAEDIRRHLDGRPVRARQDSFTYRARKFVRRRRFELVGATVVVLSLLVGMLMALSQWRQAEAARRTAEKAQRQAEAQRTVAEQERGRAEAAQRSEAAEHRVADDQRDQALRGRQEAEQRLTELLDMADRALFGVNDAIAPFPGTVEARRMVVRATLDYLESLEKSHGLNDRMRLVLSTSYDRLGLIQGDPLGPSLMDSAGAEQSYHKAESLLAPLFARRPNDPDVLLIYLDIQRSLAGFNARANHNRESVALLEKLLPWAHRLGQLAPDNEATARQEAEIQLEISRGLLDLSQADASLEHANKGIALMTDLVARFPKHRPFKRELGTSYASAAAATHDLEKAASYYLHSIEIREPALAEEPADVAMRRGLLVVYAHYAGVLGLPNQNNLGRYDEARLYCQKSVAIARELASDPKNATAQYDLGVALAHLGMAEPGPGGLAESLKSLQESTALIEPVARGNPKSSSFAYQLSVAQQYKGRRLDALGQTSEGVLALRQALSTIEPFAAPGGDAHACIVQAFNTEADLAVHFAKIGDRAAALEFADRAVARAAAFAEADPKSERRKGWLARTSYMRADVARAFGDWQQARESAERAISLWGAVHEQDVLDFHKPVRLQAEALLRDATGRAQ